LPLCPPRTAARSGREHRDWLQPRTASAASSER
jgi:hypothetical protein